MALYKKVLGFILSLSIMAAVSLQAWAGTAGSTCREEVDAFVSLPTEHTLAALYRSDRAGCWSLIGSSNAALGQLNHWAEQGNRWAAEYMAKHVKQLDGGNLEDALIALGQFSDHHMERFLLFANKGLLSKRELTDALTMLPLSLSDNPPAQLALLSARKRKVMHIPRNDLSEQKAWATSAINDFASEIRSKNPGARL